MSTIKLDRVIRQAETGLGISPQEVRDAVGKNLDPGEETKLRGLLTQPDLSPDVRSAIEGLLRPQTEGGLPRMGSPGSAASRVWKGAVAGVVLGGGGGAAAGATFLGIGALPGGLLGALGGGLTGAALGFRSVPAD